jgi:hypothetical protein
MPQPADPRKRLDVPLVWDTKPEAEAGRRAVPGGSPPEAGHPRQLLRLWLAVLADVGTIAVALVSAWLVALLVGATLAPGQLALAILTGALIATVVGVGLLWGWRATPGMVLVGLAFTAPLPLGRAAVLWLWWIASLPFAGIPLLLGRGGRCWAERLAGAPLSSS